MISPTSRYAGVPTATYASPGGREVVYLRRRFVPAPETLATVREHIVALGERLDVIAAHQLDDPEQFWRIADANRALRPEELTERPGRRLRITLPEGVPGLANG
jgi:hypothetical protein